MTTPTASAKTVAFFCGDDLYAYSAETGRWAVLVLEKRPKENFSVSDNSVILRTNDDVRIFTTVSGKWWSKGASDSSVNANTIGIPGTANSVSPVPTSSDPFGGNPFGNDPLGTAGGDPFSSTPEANPFGSSRTGGNVSNNASDSADPFGPGNLLAGSTPPTSVADRAKEIRTRRAKIEEECVSLAKQVSKLEDGKEKTAKIRSLQAAVVESFKLKLLLDTGELKLMEQKITQSKAKLVERSERRNELITKRIDKLLKEQSSDVKSSNRRTEN